MMISAAPSEARQTQPCICSGKPEQRGLPVGMLRIMGLETAAKFIGKGRLADELCITPRSLHHKLDAARGISDADIIAAAHGLEQEAERILAHAQKLRAVVSPAVALAAADMLATAKELREGPNADCNSVREAMMWEAKAAALNPDATQTQEAELVACLAKALSYLDRYKIMTEDQRERYRAAVSAGGAK